MSTVFYRWGAGRDESRVTFDGTHISVFDLKREIILNNKMGNGKDFDIGIYDNVTGEELKDDNHQIPRSSSLIARRLPSSNRGRGNAQNYIVGTAAADALNNQHRLETHAVDQMKEKMNRGVRGAGGTFGALSKRFDGKEEKKPGEPVQITTGDAEEDARIKAMLGQEADQWEQTLEDMSTQTRGNQQFRKPRPAATGPTGGKFDYSMPPEAEPPVGYICYRCGQKGHWIQNCPNNDDPNAAERKRFVRVTGIPRSFLKTVETPVGAEGSSGGAMLTADGGFVMAMPDQRQFKKHVASKPRTLTGQEVRDQQPENAELSCPICKKLVWEAKRTPCCSTAYCEECIQTYLLEHGFECPNCESRVPSLEDLTPDDELRQRVRGYVDGEIERSQREEREEKEQAEKEGAEGGKSPVKSEEGAIDPTPGENEPKQPPQPAGIDPLKIQEMLNPQTMKTYMTQVAKMMQNPQVGPAARALLQAQVELVQSSVMQMQLMGMANMMSNGNNQNNNMNGNVMNGGMGVNGNNGNVGSMNQGMQMGMMPGQMPNQNQMMGMPGQNQMMGMPNMMMPGMDFNMGGMGMGMNNMGMGDMGQMNQMNQMGQMGQMGMNGFPNGGRGRGGRGFQRGGRGGFHPYNRNQRPQGIM